MIDDNICLNICALTQWKDHEAYRRTMSRLSVRNFDQSLFNNATKVLAELYKAVDSVTNICFMYYKMDN